MPPTVSGSVLLSEQRGFGGASVTVTVLKQFGEVAALAVFELPEGVDLLGHAPELQDAESLFSLSSPSEVSHAGVPEVRGGGEVYVVRVGPLPSGTGPYCYRLELPYRFTEPPGLDMLRLSGCTEGSGH